MSLNVKNIIFDLGGVLLNINYQLTSELFVKNGLLHFDDLFAQSAQNKVFNKFETGILSDEEFREYIRGESEKNLSDEIIDECWGAMLLDLPLSRLEYLEKLKEDYQIFLLSNTNAIHVNQFSKYIDSIYGMDRFISLFRKYYFSNEIGLRKPNTDIFEYVLKENNINPTETLFIDDSIQHVNGALSVGINAHLLEKGGEVSQLIKSLL